MCKNKPKFGGDGNKKKACLLKFCKNRVFLKKTMNNFASIRKPDKIFLNVFFQTKTNFSAMPNEVDRYGRQRERRVRSPSRSSGRSRSQSLKISFQEQELEAIKLDLTQGR